MVNRYVAGSAWVAGVIIADQGVKALMRMIDPSVSVIPGFLDIATTTNTGAAFGLLAGYPWLVTLLSIVIIVLLAGVFVREKGSSLFTASFGLIIGGALSNLIDRLVFGAVLDFIAFSFWPSFNIADSCICVGAGLLILHSVLKK